MRQPKYRCWDGKKKKMLEGGVDFYTIPLGSQPLALLNGGMVVDPLFIQFTGLYDVNGNEVFEGDIVNCSSGCPHVVEWLDEVPSGAILGGGMPGFYFSGLPENYAYLGSEEIIGNIYQHPELIPEHFKEEL